MLCEYLQALTGTFCLYCEKMASTIRVKRYRFKLLSFELTFQILRPGQVNDSVDHFPSILSELPQVLTQRFVVQPFLMNRENHEQRESEGGSVSVRGSVGMKGKKRFMSARL